MELVTAGKRGSGQRVPVLSTGPMYDIGSGTGAMDMNNLSYAGHTKYRTSGVWRDLF